MNTKEIAELLWKFKKTVAVAESCTGGFLAHTLTNISGSSRYFIAGLVVYSNAAKSKLLGIPPAAIIRFGAVSKQVAAAMAEKVRALTHADFGIATTGIAGPSGGSAQKPVGTVYVAIASKHSTNVQRYLLHGSRISIKNKTTAKALLQLKKCLKNQ